MPRRRRKAGVDLEVDLHGHTADEMRHLLERGWPEWRGMAAVRLVHGQGEVLRPALISWCREMGIPFESEPYNPGSALIFPSRRSLPEVHLKVTLGDKGLTLPAGQENYVPDPAGAGPATGAAQQRAEERKRRAEAAILEVKERQDEALWLAETSRLDKEDRRRGVKPAGDAKPAGPVILPHSELKHQEGWWRAELVRVADTDTETLKVQKRTGLEKLAPPVTAEKPKAAAPGRPARPTRDEAAERLLFEQELDRLNDSSRPSC